MPSGLCSDCFSPIDRPRGRKCKRCLAPVPALATRAQVRRNGFGHKRDDALALRGHDVQDVSPTTIAQILDEPQAQIDRVLAACAAGSESAIAIAALLGFDKKKVSAFLSSLRDMGCVTGEASGRMGGSKRWTATGRPRPNKGSPLFIRAMQLRLQTRRPTLPGAPLSRVPMPTRLPTAHVDGLPAATHPAVLPSPARLQEPPPHVVHVAGYVPPAGSIARSLLFRTS